MSLLSKWFWSIAFETLDRRRFEVGKWQHPFELQLRGNRQTGEKYVVMNYQGESSPRMTAGELASFIEAAQAIHRQMV